MVNQPAGSNDKNGKNRKGPGAPGKPELSPEDQELRDKLAAVVERLADPIRPPSEQRTDLDFLANSLKQSSSDPSGMATVPKPLKFLRPHFASLLVLLKSDAETGAVVRDPENARLLNDILSFLAVTIPDAGAAFSCLRHKLAGNWASQDLASWGHGYVRHLAGEVASVYVDHYGKVAQSAAETGDDAGSPTAAKPENAAAPEKDVLLRLVDEILPFYMTHNAEVEACDLLIDVEDVPRITRFADEKNAARVVEYLEACSGYLGEDEAGPVMRTILGICRSSGMISHAMRLALRLRDAEEAVAVFRDASSEVMRVQLAYQCAEHGVFLESIAESAGEEIAGILRSTFLSKHHLQVAEALEVLPPKKPEDIYKLGAVDEKSGTSVDRAKTNLASSYVNAFVHAGFTKDALASDDDAWIHRNRDHTRVAATAGYGLVNLWNVEEGANRLDKYVSAGDDSIKAGGLLGVGVLCSRVIDEFGVAMGVLSDHVNEGSARDVRLAAILGLGLAYASTAKREALELLLPYASNLENKEVCAFAALACGLIMVGTGDQDTAESIMCAMMVFECEAPSGPDSETTEDMLMKLLALALGLVSMGRQDASDALVEAIQATSTSKRVARLAEVCVTAFAYANSGNVLQIQKMLRLITQVSVAAASAKAEAEKETGSADRGAPAGAAPAPAGGAAGAGSPDVGAGAGAGAGEMASSKPQTPASSDGESSAMKDVDAGAQGGVSAGEDAVADLPSMEVAAMAVLGIAMIALAPGQPDDVQMASRALDHVLQYASGTESVAIRRALPLAIALLHASSPDNAAVALDVLSRLTHDPEPTVAQSAILATGILSFGSNHTRVASRLRALISYYSRDAHTFSTFARIALGLVFAGKGLLSIAPLHGERTLVDQRTMACLSSLLFVSAVLPVDKTIGGRFHSFLFLLAPAIRLRSLRTLLVGGEMVPVPVRVGQAVETVAQTGHQPRRITGFQTHDTPVLLGQGQRAEMANLAGLATLEEKVSAKAAKAKPFAAAEEEASSNADGRTTWVQQKKRKNVQWKTVAEDVMLEGVVIVEEDVAASARFASGGNK